MHIGQKIHEVIALRNASTEKVAKSLKLTHRGFLARTKAANIDVDRLAKISNILKYDFFKHYPIDDADAASLPVNIELAKMKSRNAELSKQLEVSKRDHLTQQRETAYLKKIVGLLEKKD